MKETTPRRPEGADVEAVASKDAVTASWPARRLQHWWRDKRWHAGTLTYTTGGMLLLFLWLLGGDFAFWFKERAAPQTLQVLLRTVSASDLVTGFFLVSLPQLIAVVVNPIFGYLSDRHRGRWGRRIPFLLIPTPIAVVAMVGLAFGPVLGRSLHQALGHWSMGESATVILVLGLFWTTFEFCSVVCNALLMALIADVVPREVIGRFFALFRIASLGAGMVFNFYLFGHAEEHYFAIFLLMAVVYSVGFGLMCLMVREGTYPPPPAVSPGQGLARGTVVAVKSYFEDTLKRSYYRWIFLGWALGFMMGVPINAYTVYYATSVGMSDESLGKFFTLQLSISLIQSYPIGWLVDRFHALRLTIIALISFAAVTFTAFLAVKSARDFGIAVVACGVMAGFWATASAAVGTVLFPKTKFGTFYSIQLVVNAVGTILMATMCGWALDRLGHEYRYMYLWAAMLASLAVVVNLIVYRRFRQYGGVNGYVAPE